MIRLCFSAGSIMIGFARPEAFRHRSKQAVRRYPEALRAGAAAMQRLQMHSSARLSRAGQGVGVRRRHCAVRVLAGGGACYRWQTRAARALARAYAVADKWRASFSEDQRPQRIICWSRNHGFPAYMAGAFSPQSPAPDRRQLRKKRDCGATKQENNSVKTPDRHPCPRLSSLHLM